VGDEQEGAWSRGGAFGRAREARVRFSAKSIERWYYAARDEQDPIRALERKVAKHAGTRPAREQSRVVASDNQEVSRRWRQRARRQPNQSLQGDGAEPLAVRAIREFPAPASRRAKSSDQRGKRRAILRHSSIKRRFSHAMARKSSEISAWLPASSQKSAAARDTASQCPE
jgi:hypothetical protein